MSVDERLAELGITLPDAPAPAAVYRPAVKSGNLIIVSGQVATRDGAIMTPGRLGDAVSLEDGYAAARQCGINALAAAKSVHGTLEGLRVLRTVGYVASTPEFTDHPRVVNGASELFRDVLGEDLGIGARVAFGVAALPANSPVEVEVMLEVVS
ncbi:MAG: RidA family protein [Dehalococcoidia bacterium]|nr:RidA family protein [Dehalococcoidia bacterium]MCA9857123.1 RidA family protein [Dehalococcoidia bacterium]MCB9490876.1 RidA family protein [Dehalococcoidia bacterium]